LIRAVDAVDAVDAVGLRGRGGAGYPLARKLTAVAARRRPGVVVVNGAESEPASGKDAVLLQRAPHLVLDGAAIAAEVVGADDVVLWLHAGHRSAAESAAAVRHALAERDVVDPLPLRLEFGPPGYLAGESSALISYLSGGPLLPTLTPPHATERGVDGRPTVVSNVETLAQLALLARHGPDWFRGVGTPDEPGTLLVSVTGGVRRPTRAGGAVRHGAR
jgi:NADH:ubiquinone oxidoreductase subunit F (NADH-binding)